MINHLSIGLVENLDAMVVFIYIQMYIKWTQL